MAIKPTITTRGGDKLRRALREAGKGGVRGVNVGFYSTSRYEDGTPVALVAAVNEFGAPDKGIPERPYFRKALADSGTKRGISNLVKNKIDAKRMVIELPLANDIGEFVGLQVQESIRSLRTPPNAPDTIARKGSSNPLIDTGFMRQSVAHEVER